MQAEEEHVAELKQMNGQLSHALGESRRIQLQNEEMQQSIEHYRHETSRLKVCETWCILQDIVQTAAFMQADQIADCSAIPISTFAFTLLIMRKNQSVTGIGNRLSYLETRQAFGICWVSR